MLEKFARDITYSDIVSFCNENVPESRWLDYKETFSQTDNKQVGKIVSAMANAHGGWILFGIKEGAKNSKGHGLPGELLGIEVEKKTSERIKQICLDSIYPPIAPEIQDVAVPGDSKRVLTVVRVHESQSAPHQTSEGKVYIRTGDVSHVSADGKLASVSEIEFLLNRRAVAKQTFDRLYSQANARIGINPLTPILFLNAVPTFCVEPLTDYSTLVSIAEGLQQYDLLINSKALHSANESVFHIFERKTPSENSAQRAGFDLNIYGQLFYKTIIRGDGNTVNIATPVNGHVVAGQLFSFLQICKKLYGALDFSGLISLTIGFACEKDCILTIPWCKPTVNIPDSRFTIELKCLTYSLSDSATFCTLYRNFLWAAGIGPSILSDDRIDQIYSSLRTLGVK